MKRNQDALTIVCPTCQGTMYRMGWSFHAPKKSNVEQWKKVQFLYAEGFRFFGSGWGKGIPLPKKYKEVKNFIEEYPNHGLRTAKRLPSLIPK